MFLSAWQYNCVTAPIFTMKAVHLDDIINVNFAESNSMGDTHNHVEIFSTDEYLFDWNTVCGFCYEQPH